MGNCCCCRGRSGTGTAPPPVSSVAGTNTVTQAAQSLQAVKPGPVRNLTITLDPNRPSVTLQWAPPANALTTQDVTAYDIRFKPSDRDHYDHRVVGGHKTSIMLTRNMGLVPLVRCVFEVRARNFDHVGPYRPITTTVEWHCRHPVCTASRRVVRERFAVQSKVYDFCSRPCAVDFGKTYCPYPDCGLEKQCVDGAAAAPAEFCSDDHLQRATQEGLAVVVEVEPKSREFKGLCRKFSRDWKKAKGKCPKIEFILRIVNPGVTERFNTYREQLPKRNQAVEQHYHGTELACGLQEYLQLCKYPNCGVCGITHAGFEQSKINRSTWQRFGHGFYLAPNSSKSHDYTRSSSDGYHGMFLCDVAPGRTKKQRKSTPHVHQPAGCDSVRGVTKISILGVEIVGGDLNYPEMVVYTSDAILPRCIFLYRSVH